MLCSIWKMILLGISQILFYNSAYFLTRQIQLPRNVTLPSCSFIHSNRLLSSWTRIANPVISWNSANWHNCKFTKTKNILLSSVHHGVTIYHSIVCLSGVQLSSVEFLTILIEFKLLQENPLTRKVPVLFGFSCFKFLKSVVTKCLLWVKQ